LHDAAVERELDAPVDIAHPDGRLRREAVGWARHPIQRCGLAPGLARVARWNYWCVTSRTSALTLLVADVGWLGIGLVSFLDFAARRPVERVWVRPGGLPIALPDSPRGEVALDVSRLRLSMRTRDETMRLEGEARTLFGRRIAIDLDVARPHAHETINVLVPWPGDDTRFQFTSKQQALPARGVVRVDGREHRFDAAGDAFACLDFGRGRWPSRIEWNWAFASGARGGRSLGLNLGGQWTDGTGVTENGFVLDGRLHKISDAVDFAYDPRDFLRPWTIRSREGARVDLQFLPRRERAVKLPLGVVFADLHQLVGVFRGHFLDDAGERVAVDDLIGQAEAFRGRW
jgi:hypothetical protein